MVVFLASFSSYLRMTEGAYMVLLTRARHRSPKIFNWLATHESVDILVPTLAIGICSALP